MTATVLGIMTDRGQTLPFSRDLREAVAKYARQTWPHKTARSVAHEWGLDQATAANLLKGHASDATLTKVLRKGGWRVAAVVVGSVIGETYESFLEQELEHIAAERRRIEDLERATRNNWARLHARRALDSGHLSLVAEMDTAVPDEDGSRGRELGARKAR